MSLTARQHTCAACGAPVQDTDPHELEPIVDGTARYVVVHRGHTCYPTGDVTGNATGNQP